MEPTAELTVEPTQSSPFIPYTAELVTRQPLLDGTHQKSCGSSRAIIRCREQTASRTLGSQRQQDGELQWGGFQAEVRCAGGRERGRARTVGRSSCWHLPFFVSGAVILSRRSVLAADRDPTSQSLLWAYLQEKLTTTPYGDAAAPDVFQFPVFLNTIQSAFAAATGGAYLYFSTPKGQLVPPVIPGVAILGPLLLVATTSALASPFGYASLAHIDYITYLLAKSCKLLPVMLLHTTLFRKRYPMYKYVVVAAVTAGVAVFALHSGKKRKGAAALQGERNYPWGLLLLSINLLQDGLTNTTQEYIFAAFRPFSGPQMMCANNMMATAVTATYLLASRWLFLSTPAAAWLGMDAARSSGELGAALEFLAKYPDVWSDVLGFAACGAVGQVFICESPDVLCTLPPSVPPSEAQLN